jgi:hypothetical protein
VWTMCQILCRSGWVSLGRLPRIAFYTINRFFAYKVLGLFGLVALAWLSRLGLVEFSNSPRGWEGVGDIG